MPFPWNFQGPNGSTSQGGSTPSWPQGTPAPGLNLPPRPTGPFAPPPVSATPGVPGEPPWRQMMGDWHHRFGGQGAPDGDGDNDGSAGVQGQTGTPGAPNFNNVPFLGALQQAMQNPAQFFGGGANSNFATWLQNLLGQHGAGPTSGVPSGSAPGSVPAVPVPPPPPVPATPVNAPMGDPTRYGFGPGQFMASMPNLTPAQTSVAPAGTPSSAAAASSLSNGKFVTPAYVPPSGPGVNIPMQNFTRTFTPPANPLRYGINGGQNMFTYS